MQWFPEWGGRASGDGEEQRTVGSPTFPQWPQKTLDFQRPLGGVLRYCRTAEKFLIDLTFWHFDIYTPYKFNALVWVFLIPKHSIQNHIKGWSLTWKSSVWGWPIITTALHLLTSLSASFSSASFSFTLCTNICLISSSLLCSSNRNSWRLAS